MIYYQVEDIEEIFKDLSKLEEKNWVQEDVGPSAKAVVKKKVVKKALYSSSLPLIIVNLEHLANAIHPPKKMNNY